MLPIGPVIKFLQAARSLSKQGVKKEQILEFARREFGKVSELLKRQIDDIYSRYSKPATGGKKPGEVVPIKRKPIDPDDALPNYKETPGAYSRRITPGTKENLLEQLKIVYRKRYNNLRGDETAEELKKIIEQAKKTDVPFGSSGSTTDDLLDLSEPSDTDMLRKGIEQLESLKAPGASLDPVTGLTRTLARRILEKKGIEIGKKDPLDVFNDTFGESIVDVKNLAEEMIEIDRRGGGLKNIDQMLEADGLFDIKIPQNPNRAIPNDELLDQLKKDLNEKEILEDFLPPKDRKPSAEGGLMRTSYAIGSGVKLATFLLSKGKKLKQEIKKAVDDIFPSGDSKYDADVAVDNLFEGLGVDKEMFDQKDVMDAYGEAYGMITKQKGLMSTKVPGGKTPKSSTQVFKDAEGKTKGISMGGDDAFNRKLADAMEEGIKESENMKRFGFDPSSQKDYFKYQEMKKAGQLQKNVTEKSEYQKTIESISALDNDINRRVMKKELKKEFLGITDTMIEDILMDADPQRIAEVKQTMREALEMQSKGMGPDEIVDIFKRTTRRKQATGGRVKMAKGGLPNILGF